VALLFSALVEKKKRNRNVMCQTVSGSELILGSEVWIEKAAGDEISFF